MKGMVPKHFSWTVLTVLCFSVGCRQPSQASAAPTVPSPQQLLDQVILPQDQMTPALIESDQANIVFANQEMAFAQKNEVARTGDGSSGPLSIEEAQEHLQTANLVLKVDQDRVQTQQDITNLRVYTVPIALRSQE